MRRGAKRSRTTTCTPTTTQLYDHTTEEIDMGNIRKVVLVRVAVVAGLIATGTESYSSASGCHGGTCITVNGKGLRVTYATVTNKDGQPTGRGLISSTWDGQDAHRTGTLQRAFLAV
jgi:hypothetical protein